MRSTIKARLEVILAIVVTILTASVAIGVSRMAQGHADIVGIIDGPAKRQARSLPVQVAANESLRPGRNLAASGIWTPVCQFDPRTVGGDASDAATNIAAGSRAYARGSAPRPTHGGRDSGGDAFGQAA